MWPALTNTRPLVPEVLVRDSEWAVVRPRLEADQLVALDRLPHWLGVQAVLLLREFRSPPLTYALRRREFDPSSFPSAAFHAAGIAPIRFV